MYYNSFSDLNYKLLSFPYQTSQVPESVLSKTESSRFWTATLNNSNSQTTKPNAPKFQHKLVHQVYSNFGIYKLSSNHFYQSQI
jgi:hypothetical protein